VKAGDAGLHRKVLLALDSVPLVRDQEIGIAVRDGVVTLFGYVDDYERKHMAERIAAGVNGVEALVCRLGLRTPGPQGHTDTEIARSVVDSLRHLNVPEERVTARVERAWVTLEGDVDLYLQKQAAEEDVRALPGVRGVTNALTVKLRHSPDAIKSKIKLALVQRAHLDAERIAVEVRGGAATLSGCVCSESERQKALEAARSAPSIAEVEDRLTVLDG
jgi:osmotically-inducible protein OsmY